MEKIYINYDENILRGTLKLLDVSPLKKLISPGMKISIKPNMVLAKPPSEGATTHPEIVEGLICYLKDCGIHDIEIIESAWIGADTWKAYRACGFDRLSTKYGVPLYDLKEDRFRKIKTGKYEIEICNKAADTDFLINVPVLKAHCQTLLTCNMKNLKGCITDREKRRFHTLGLHGPIAYLNQAIKTHFCVVDGICGDLTFEEGGNPVTRNMLLAGQDPLLLDSYCAGLIGYRADEIGYLQTGSAVGLGRLYDENTELIELNQEHKPVTQHSDRGIAARLRKYIREDQACSACYSALIFALHQTDSRTLNKLSDKINIGQGFRGKEGLLGCGNCTAGHRSYVKGCPPSAVDVAAHLLLFTAQCH